MDPGSPLDVDPGKQSEAFLLALRNLPIGLRAIPEAGAHKPILSGVFDRAEKAATAARVASEAGYNVFVNINRLTPRPATNRLAPGESIKAADIERITTFVLDLDPKRPAGACATDEEHELALERGRRAVDLARSLGWPNGTLVDSGNGQSVYWPLAGLPNDAESNKLIRGAHGYYGSKLDDERVQVDKSVHDPARVMRLPGTWNRKAASPDRPQRMATLLALGDGVVTREQLEALTRKSLPCDPHQARVEALKAWALKAGLDVGEVREKEDGKGGRFTVLPLHMCPFKKEQSDGNTGILLFPDGRRGFKCFHERCRDKTFASLERLVQCKFADVVDGLLGLDRAFNDPLALAARQLRQWAVDGHNTFVCVNGDCYRWSAEYGWRQVTFQELEPLVRATVQAVYDEHAHAVGRLTGDYCPRPVRGHVVADVWRAMMQLAYHEVPPTAQAPYWLGDSGGWAAEDVLALRNGHLNVRHWIEGKECFRPPSPALFYEHSAPFAFDPKAPRPEEWHRFLDSLEMGDEWIRFVQQVFGYLLWPALDWQKFFVLVGPRRSGKGTLANVMERLVGGPQAVCALNIEDFASDFGLEPALGKRLAFVPECRIPDKKVYAVVANIKSITGADMVQVKRKGIRNLSVRLLIKLILSTNEFLPLPDHSGALEARTIPIRLNKSFYGKEDKALSAKLAAESPGILLWALEGLRDLCNVGEFSLPESTLEEMRQLADEVAPLRPFVEECCTVDNSLGCHSAALYAVYRRWAADNGHDLLSEGRFASALRTTVPSVTKDRAPRADATSFKGRTIVTGNVKQGRPPVWLGITPKV